MKYSKVAIIVFCFFSLNTLKAQTGEFKSSIRTDFSIPVLTSNAALRSSFIEVFDISVSAARSIGKSFFIAPGIKYSYFSLDTIKYFANANQGKLRTKYNIIIPGVELGYQKTLGKSAWFNASVNVGYALGRYRFAGTEEVPPIEGYNYNSLAIEPNIRFYFYTTNRLALGFKVSYQYINNVFDYRQFRLDQFGATFTPADVTGNTQYLNFGVIAMLGTGKP